MGFSSEEKILALEKIRNIYTTRLDNCIDNMFEVKRQCIQGGQDPEEHDIYKTYQSLVEKYKKIINAINNKQKDLEDYYIAYFGTEHFESSEN